MADENELSHRRVSPRRHFFLWATILVFLAGLGAVVAVQLVGVSKQLEEARDHLDTATGSLQEGDLLAARNALADAEGLVVDANDRLRGSMAIDAVDWLPGISHNIGALEDSLDLAMTVVHGGSRILAESTPLESESGTLEVSLSDGTFPIDAVRSARLQIEDLLSSIVLKSEPRDSSLLAPPVRELRKSVIEDTAERESQLRVLNSGLELIEEFSGASQPRRYLLAIANTAEMRGSGGMILNYGVLEGRDGTVDLTAFGRVDDIALSGPVSEDLVPADYLARWNGFDQLGRWRQANLAADFTVVAPVLEAMFTAATGLPVDGVIQVDPEGLAAILEGVGPVQVGELGQVSAENVISLTMHEAYIKYPGVEDRSDVLGDVAEAAFQKLVDGDIPSLRTLATAVAEAVDGRHILAHSRSDTIQQRFSEFGADGGLPAFDSPDAFSLTAQNLSGNKLDYFLDTSLELAEERLAGEIGEVRATVALTNTAPADATEPRYIYGPGPAERTPAGVLRSLVTLYLPAGTTLAGSSGDTPVEPVVAGVEAGRPYVSFTFDVPAAQSRSISLSLELAPRAPGPYEVVFVPSPRIRPTSVVTDLNLGGGRLNADIILDRTWLVSTDRQPVPLLAPIHR